MATGQRRIEAAERRSRLGSEVDRLSGVPESAGALDVLRSILRSPGRAFGDVYGGRVGQISQGLERGLTSGAPLADAHVRTAQQQQDARGQQALVAGRALGDAGQAAGRAFTSAAGAVADTYGPDGPNPVYQRGHFTDSLAEVQANPFNRVGQAVPAGRAAEALTPEEAAAQQFVGTVAPGLVPTRQGDQPSAPIPGGYAANILNEASARAFAQQAQLEKGYQSQVDALRAQFQLAETPAERAALQFILGDLEAQRAAAEQIIDREYGEAVAQADARAGALRELGVEHAGTVAGEYQAAGQRLADTFDQLRTDYSGMGAGVVDVSGDATDYLGVLEAAGMARSGLAQDLTNLGAQDVAFLGQAMAGEGAAQQGQLARSVLGLSADATMQHNAQVNDRIARERLAMNQMLADLQGQQANRSLQLELAGLGMQGDLANMLNQNEQAALNRGHDTGMLFDRANLDLRNAGWLNEQEAGLQAQQQYRDFQIRRLENDLVRQQQGGQVSPVSLARQQQMEAVHQWATTAAPTSADIANGAPQPWMIAAAFEQAASAAPPNPVDATAFWTDWYGTHDDPNAVMAGLSAALGFPATPANLAAMDVEGGAPTGGVPQGTAPGAEPMHQFRPGVLDRLFGAGR